MCHSQHFFLAGINYHRQHKDKATVEWPFNQHRGRRSFPLKIWSWHVLLVNPIFNSHRLPLCRLALCEEKRVTLMGAFGRAFERQMAFQYGHPWTSHGCPWGSRVPLPFMKKGFSISSLRFSLVIFFIWWYKSFRISYGTTFPSFSLKALSYWQKCS